MCIYICVCVYIYIYIYIDLLSNFKVVSLIFFSNFTKIYSIYISFTNFNAQNVYSGMNLKQGIVGL